MNESDRRNKNQVLITYLKSIITDYKIKAEYSTNDKDIKVIVVQETSGSKTVFFNNDNHLYNYFNVEVFGDNIQDQYYTMAKIGDLIGKDVILSFNNKKWQIIFKQYSNPRTIQYSDIRRISYTMTLQCVVNKIQS